MDNEVSVLVLVLNYGMLQVEYNIWPYNVGCGIICLRHVPSVLRVASMEISTSLDRWFHSFQVTMVNDFFCLSDNNNDVSPLFHILMKKQHQIAIINPAFDITIVYPGSSLHLVELSKRNYLCYRQKKS